MSGVELCLSSLSLGVLSEQRSVAVVWEMFGLISAFMNGVSSLSLDVLSDAFCFELGCPVCAWKVCWSLSGQSWPVRSELGCPREAVNPMCSLGLLVRSGAF